MHWWIHSCHFTISVFLNSLKEIPLKMFWTEVLKSANVEKFCNAICTLSLSAFGESCLRWDWASATLYTLAERSQFWRATRGDSQGRHETLWLVHHGPLKKQDLNEARHKRRGYTRRSKAMREFSSTFSLLPCLRFPRRECTAGITFASNTRLVPKVLQLLIKTRLGLYLMKNYIITLQYNACSPAFGRPFYSV